MRLFFLKTIALCFSINTISAQTFDLGSWNILNVKYNIEGFVNGSKDALFFTTDLINSEMLDSFKKCSIVKIRVNESTCTNEIYSFNMSKSTSALSYINYK